MSEDILEIHRKIMNTPPGDGDGVLNILEAMLQKMADMERQISDLRRQLRHGTELGE